MVNEVFLVIAVIRDRLPQLKDCLTSTWLIVSVLKLVKVIILFAMLAREVSALLLKTLPVDVDAGIKLGTKGSEPLALIGLRMALTTTTMLLGSHDFQPDRLGVDCMNG